MLRARHYEAKGLPRPLPVPFDCGLASYGIATLEGQLPSPACERFIAALRDEARRYHQAQQINIVTTPLRDS